MMSSEAGLEFKKPFLLSQLNKFENRSGNSTQGDEHTRENQKLKEYKELFLHRKTQFFIHFTSRKYCSFCMSQVFSQVNLSRPNPGRKEKK